MIFKICAGTTPSKVNFGTNLVSNMSTEAPKKDHIQCPICTFVVHIRCKFYAHFGWEVVYSFVMKESYTIYIIHRAPYS